MSDFTVTIEMGNDAMREATDVADALQEIIAHLHGGQTDGAIRDVNGNTVGRFHMDHPDWDTDDYPPLQP